MTRAVEGILGKGSLGLDTGGKGGGDGEKKEAPAGEVFRGEDSFELQRERKDRHSLQGGRRGERKEGEHRRKE